MIRVFLQGGLGNQMFQYAVGRHLALRRGVGLCLDTSWYYYPVQRRFLLDQFGLEARTSRSPLSFVSNLWFHQPWQALLGFSQVYREKNRVFDPTVFDAGESVILIGFFQSEKYFKDVESTIRLDLSFGRVPARPETESWARQIADTNAVAVHVRRGDYLKIPAFQTCSEKYYHAALNYLRERLEDPVFYFFSDDLEWCRKTYATGDCHFCDNAATVDNPVNDMRLFALCRHHIVSNSSFSWWGAWLGKTRNQLVVAPDRWRATADNMEDIPCPSWIKLPASA